jgi:hypothetical protein
MRLVHHRYSAGRDAYKRKAGQEPGDEGVDVHDVRPDVPDQ